MLPKMINTGLSNVNDQRDLVAQSLQIFGMMHGFPKDEVIFLMTADYYHEEPDSFAGLNESFLMTDHSNNKVCMMGICLKDIDWIWKCVSGRNDLKWSDLQSGFSEFRRVSLSSYSKANAWANVNSTAMYKKFLERFPIIVSAGEFRDPITIKSYARVGLMGNPSDGFFGKTISFLIKNFCAQVTIVPHKDSTNEHILIGERIRFSSFGSFLANIKLNGYDGISRLILATLKVFFSYTANQEKCKRGFTVFYETNIPRQVKIILMNVQVGLSGSSAIITGLLKALKLFYGLEIKLEILANLALSAEKDELKIAAGLQDRVIQTFGGLVYMDFNKEQMQTYGYGIYESLSVAKLPSLWIAYCSNPKDSGKVHSDINRRFLDNDPIVLEAMTKFASFAEQAKHDILNGDVHHLAHLMNQNFNLRRDLYGDEVIGEMNLYMINLARSHGMAAKFCGSGGCIVGMHCGPREKEAFDIWEFRCALVRNGFIFAFCNVEAA
jgi:galactokinase/mevalonate kinase-like predicted kinase